MKSQYYRSYLNGEVRSLRGTPELRNAGTLAGRPEMMPNPVMLHP
ncbi:hypothetical protein [Microcystis aeruginosa]|nr:hypothetical protein [Microcystis aeruginosa]MDB9420647.1 hypothetical protein [Microcystis aeruginosa CS-563/04]